MAIKLSNLKPKPKTNRRSKRIGRGDSSGFGSYSGRGQKGQRSRSGGKKGLKIRGLRHNIRNLPKFGGFKSHRARMDVFNLSDLEKIFKSNDIVDIKKFKKNGISKKKFCWD